MDSPSLGKGQEIRETLYDGAANLQDTIDGYAMICERKNKRVSAGVARAVQSPLCFC